MVPFSFFKPLQVLNTDSVFAEEKAALLSPHAYSITEKHTGSRDGCESHTCSTGAPGKMWLSSLTARARLANRDALPPERAGTHAHSPARTPPHAHHPQHAHLVHPVRMVRAPKHRLGDKMPRILSSPHFLKLEAGVGEQGPLHPRKSLRQVRGLGSHDGCGSSPKATTTTPELWELYSPSAQEASIKSPQDSLCSFH